MGLRGPPGPPGSSVSQAFSFWQMLMLLNDHKADSLFLHQIQDNDMEEYKNTMILC